MKKRVAILSGSLLLCAMLFGCSNQTKQADVEAPAGVEETVVSEAGTKAEETVVSEDNAECPLEDGIYTADFDTDSSMFHVNEACDGKGTLTVKDGKMTIHISLGSKKIVNLYYGLAIDAQKDGAELIEPTVDTVDYADGTTEEVYGFDVPVPALDAEFDVALIGTKGKWYDHKVQVSNPQPANSEASATDDSQNAEPAAVEDGTYTIELDFAGGSGKAHIFSPATLTVTNGEMIATVEWSSPNYDYMLVDGEKYMPVNTDGNSVFEIPVSKLDEPMDVIGDTVAMSKPHEIEYTLTFHADTMKEAQ